MRTLTTTLVTATLHITCQLATYIQIIFKFIILHINTYFCVSVTLASKMKLIGAFLPFDVRYNTIYIKKAPQRGLPQYFIVREKLLF